MTSDMVMVPKGEIEELAREVAALRERVTALEGGPVLEAPDAVAGMHAGFRARAREIEARTKV